MRFKTIGLPVALFTLFAFTITSCEKDEMDEPGEQEQETMDPDSLQPDAILLAMNRLSTTTEALPEEEVGYGIAFFLVNDSTYQDAGEVTLNGEALNQGSNFSYSYPINQSTGGLDFSNEVNWTVSGSADVPEFEKSVEFAFPHLGEITSGSTISKSNGYELEFESYSDADYFIVRIGDFSTSINQQTTNVLISSDQLSELSTGSETLVIQAYSYENYIIEEDVMAFGKVAIRSIPVTIEE